MRIAHPALGLAIAGAALGACHKHAPPPRLDAVAIPGASGAQLAPGLWVEAISDRRGVVQTRYCLDPTTAGRLAYLGGQLNSHCARRDMAQGSDGAWHFATSCDMGRWGKVSTEGVIRGDFRSHYTVEARTVTTGATATPNGESRITADLRRIGGCPPDMKPGDIVSSAGGRASINGLQAPA
ncbi:MAG TPA: DUF3617 family protein [Caulobacteraceae bacterium]|nr:DUF3617 family protein [Caulobacteraceae bacterium]